jgi:hypothetical protein
VTYPATGHDLSRSSDDHLMMVCLSYVLTPPEGELVNRPSEVTRISESVTVICPQARRRRRAAETESPAAGTAYVEAHHSLRAAKLRGPGCGRGLRHRPGAETRDSDVVSPAVATTDRPATPADTAAALS